MSLSDPKYLLLLAAVVLVFYLVQGHRARAALLLSVSYAFYWHLSGYLALALIFVTLVSYGGGLLLFRGQKAPYRGVLFSIIIILALLPLLTFKYLAFVMGPIAAAYGVLPPAMPEALSILPIGISFFTFVALGYLIDVYLDIIEPERRPMELALLLAFFPTVTAGPIERASHFLPQFNFGRLRFSSERAIAASRLIFLGLFLKVVCADSLVNPVDAIFADPSKFTPAEKLFALIHYAYYVYTDFAGYSLIAIGSAIFFGLAVLPNFHQPFLSASLVEFWRNWHISMSSWFRDYVFTPLRVHWRRYPRMGMVGALMVSFVLIGIWHGAGWTFVLFGAMHGVFVSFLTLTSKYREAIRARLRIPASLAQLSGIACTFALFTLTLVAFRARSIPDTMEFYLGIFSKDLFSAAPYFQPEAFKALGFKSWTWAIIAVVLVGDIFAKRGVLLEEMPALLQLLIYNVGAALIAYGWVAHTAPQPFLYYGF
jgi:alginate O-acetyltransferase complex protein AlgI